MIKIAHISDTHIRNLKYHDVYRNVFDQIYEILAQEKPDFVIHTGDLAHTKCELSPEYFKLAQEFLEKLDKVSGTKTIIIPGNHDGLVNNQSRTDAISPLVDNIPGISFLKTSGVIYEDADVCFHHNSIFDSRDNWTIKPDKTDGRLHIALFHGPVYGSKTDVEWSITSSVYTSGMFEHFDFALLGDIHKSNQALDDDGRIRYAGSTVQQNFGETNDKGFILWEIESRDEFKVKHFPLNNPKPFVTIELTPKGRLPKNANVPKGARLRLINQHSLPASTVRKAIANATRKYKPESVSYENRNYDESFNAGTGTYAASSTIDLRSVEVQQNLIKKYLEDFEVPEATMQHIFDINNRYNSQVTGNEEVYRNIHWHLEEFEFDNLFNYGEKNKVNWKDLHGIVGIFGKNYSGKSSVIDGLVWTITNFISKNKRKNLNVINQHKNFGAGKVKFRVDDDIFSIKRRAEKYTKKLHGKETDEARTKISFVRRNSEGVHDLSESTRNATDANIRKYFGSFDDFMLTSFVSQNNATAFIDEGSTKRKEILAKFLDLEIFEKKYRLAHDESKEVKALLKKKGNIDYKGLIDTEERSLVENAAKIKENTGLLAELEGRLHTHRVELTEHEKETSSIGSLQVIDVDAIANSISNLKATRKRHEATIATLQQTIEIVKESSVEFMEDLKGIDIDKLREMNSESLEVARKINVLEAKIQKNEVHVQLSNAKIEMLRGIPCNNSFPSCVFIKDATQQMENLKDMVESYEKSVLAKTESEEILRTLDPDNLKKSIEKFSSISSTLATNESDCQTYKHQVDTLKTKIVLIDRKVSDHQDQLKLYKEQEINQKRLVDLRSKIQVLSSKIAKMEKIRKKLDIAGRTLYQKAGSFQEKITMLKAEKANFEMLSSEFDAFDLFMKCMHPNGISFDVVRDRLRFINEEIAKILSTICEFQVYFEADGSRLEVFIKHPKHDPRPLEMGSGSEKTIASMAIRLALLRVTNLPRGDIFIMDEPATDLDAENMDGFVRMINMVKNQFRIVVLISHLETLKDIADVTIDIDKKKGFAHVYR